MYKEYGSLLEKRRDRVIAVLLGLKERELDQYLPVEAQRKFRKALLDEVNGLVELGCDLLRSVDTGNDVSNDYFRQLIEEIHSATVAGNGDA